MRNRGLDSDAIVLILVLALNHSLALGGLGGWFLGSGSLGGTLLVFGLLGGLDVEEIADEGELAFAYRLLSLSLFDSTPPSSRLFRSLAPICN